MVKNLEAVQKPSASASQIKDTFRCCCFGTNGGNNIIKQAGTSVFEIANQQPSVALFIDSYNLLEKTAIFKFSSPYRWPL